ncbi:MAG: hypothetical protein K0V04_39395 [Deltaproteobacteria bacterium]|nr:hypothetical protein [Deltaproteobacteria bacterium]
MQGPTSGRSKSVAAWMVAGALLVPGVVAAEPTVPTPPPPPAMLEFDWQVPTGCPDAEQLRARVEEMMSGPPVDGDTLSVTGTIELREPGFGLILRTEFGGRVELRELVAPSCDELGEAAAILLAIALEPELAASVSAAPPSVQPMPDGSGPPESTPVAIDPPHQPPGSRPIPPEPRHAPAQAPTRTRPKVRLRLAAVGEAGALPGVTGGPRLAVGLGWPRARLELHGGYLAPRRDDAQGQEVRYQAGAGGLRGCGRPRVGRIELPVCGGLEGGAVRATTVQSERRRTRHGPWLGPLASVGVAARWGRVGLWAALEAVVPVFSGEFLLHGALGFRRFPVSSRLVVGLEIIIP